jgi:Holliday junction resolvase RusA-like endonuclease
MIKLTIPGKPVGKGRAVTTRWGTHTPEGTVLYENLIKMLFLESKQESLGDKPIVCTIMVYFPITKSTSKKKRTLMLEGKLRPTKKPDCDNIAKIILDALNTLAYDDDKQVVELLVMKEYAEVPRVEVRIESREVT